MNRRALKACAVLLCAAAGSAGNAGAAETTPFGITPFKITYGIKLAGLGAGEAVVQLRVDGERWLYTSTVTPQGLLATLFGDTLQISARMRREDGRLVTEEYMKKHARNADKDQRYRFEAHGRSVEILKKGRVYFLETPPGTLDEASVQLQLIRDAPMHNGPWRYTVVSNGKIKHYRFTETGVETITTALGEIKALRVERVRVRDGKDDETDHHYWLSTAHHHLPVRIERLKNGRVSRTMTVKTLSLH